MPKTLENNRRCVSRCFLQANQAHAAAKQNDSRYQLQAWSPTQAPAAAHLRSIQIKSKKNRYILPNIFFFPSYMHKILPTLLDESKEKGEGSTHVSAHHLHAKHSGHAERNSGKSSARGNARCKWCKDAAGLPAISEVRKFIWFT